MKYSKMSPPPFDCPAGVCAFQNTVTKANSRQ